MAHPPQPTRLCVLIVDDNVDAAHTLGMLCEHLGHDVDLAHDGVAGLDAARRLRPDVIFLDLALPGIDGHEIARRLRDDSSLRARIIAVTGSAGEEERQRAHEAGFDHYLVKPVDAAFIMSLLRRR